MKCDSARPAAGDGQSQALAMARQPMSIGLGRAPSKSGEPEPGRGLVDGSRHAASAGPSAPVKPHPSSHLDAPRGDEGDGLLHG